MALLRLESVSEQEDAVEVGGDNSECLLNTFLGHSHPGVIQSDGFGLFSSLTGFVPALSVDSYFVSIKVGCKRREFDSLSDRISIISGFRSLLLGLLEEVPSVFGRDDYLAFSVLISKFTLQ